MQQLKRLLAAVLPSSVIPDVFAGAQAATLHRSPIFRPHHLPRCLPRARRQKTYPSVKPRRRPRRATNALAHWPGIHRVSDSASADSSFASASMSTTATASMPPNGRPPYFFSPSMGTRARFFTAADVQPDSSTAPPSASSTISTTASKPTTQRSPLRPGPCGAIAQLPAIVPRP